MDLVRPVMSLLRLLRSLVRLSSRLTGDFMDLVNRTEGTWKLMGRCLAEMTYVKRMDGFTILRTSFAKQAFVQELEFFPFIGLVSSKCT